MYTLITSESLQIDPCSIYSDAIPLILKCNIDFIENILNKDINITYITKKAIID